LHRVFQRAKSLQKTILFFLNHPALDLDWREYTPYGCLFFLCYILYAKNITGIRAPIGSGGLAIYKKSSPALGGTAHFSFTG